MFETEEIKRNNLLNKLFEICELSNRIKGVHKRVALKSGISERHSQFIRSGKRGHGNGDKMVPKTIKLLKKMIRNYQIELDNYVKEIEVIK